MDKHYKIRIKITTIVAWVLTAFFVLIYVSIGLMNDPTDEEIRGLLIISLFLVVLIITALLLKIRWRNAYYEKRLLDPFIDAYFIDGTKYLTQNKESFKRAKFEETVFVYKKGEFDIELSFYEKTKWFRTQMVLIVKGVVNTEDHGLVHRLIKQHAFGKNRVFKRPIYDQLLIIYEFYLTTEDNVLEPKDLLFFKQTKPLSAIINPKDNKCFVRDDVYKIAYNMRPYWRLLKEHFMVNVDKSVD